MVVSVLIFNTALSMSISYKSYFPFFFISDLSFRKTQGNKHLTSAFGSGFTFEVDNYLHSFFTLRKGESATITSAFPYNRALAAPILLPHKNTL